MDKFLTFYIKHDKPLREVWRELCVHFNVGLFEWALFLGSQYDRPYLL